MKLFRLKEFWIWFLVNVLSPIVIPLLAVLIVYFLMKLVGTNINKKFLEILELIWNSGIYVFLSLFAFVSLVPHFFGKYIPNRVSSGLYIIVMIGVLMVSSFLSVNYLNLIDTPTTPNDNLLVSIVVTFVGITIAIAFKIWFLQENNRNNITASEAILDSDDGFIAAFHEDRMPISYIADVEEVEICGYKRKITVVNIKNNNK